MSNNKPLAVIAFGGNALIQKGQSGSAEQQLDNLRGPMRKIAKLSNNFRLVLTHGNGPQVGNLLLQQESCSEVAKMPLEVIGAMTQGQIGYFMESILDEALDETGDPTTLLSTLITYTVVDENDEGFKDPTKPIGPFYTDEEAKGLPYTLKRTDKGLRRVVACPRPQSIVCAKEIKKLIEQNFIVICTGGGGIPVIRKGRAFHGVEAVIDKDLATSVLSREIKADIMVVATDADGAFINWGKPDQKQLRTVTITEMKKYQAEGHFAAGSMGPKVQAVMEYVEATGGRGVICHLDNIDQAVAGGSGTEIVRG